MCTERNFKNRWELLLRTTSKLTITILRIATIINWRSQEHARLLSLRLKPAINWKGLTSNIHSPHPIKRGMTMCKLMSIGSQSEDHTCIKFPSLITQGSKLCLEEEIAFQMTSRSPSTAQISKTILFLTITKSWGWSRIAQTFSQTLTTRTATLCSKTKAQVLPWCHEAMTSQAPQTPLMLTIVE